MPQCQSSDNELFMKHSYLWNPGVLTSLSRRFCFGFELPAIIHPIIAIQSTCDNNQRRRCFTGCRSLCSPPDEMISPAMGGLISVSIQRLQRRARYQW